MKRLAFFFTLLCFLIFPAPGRSQNTGRVECARDDDYVYLYSSMITLDVRATLQCGEVVQITGRYEGYFGVRNAKGATGYVPLAAVVLLKDQPGTGLPTTGTDTPARERIHYDDHPRPSRPSAQAAPAFTLRIDTPIKVRLLKTISSTNAHVGDAVEFEVMEEVVLEGVPVVTKGAKASGVITEAESKKRFGHSGKISFNISLVDLSNGEKAPLRGHQEATGPSSTSSADAVVPLSSGKDASIPKDTEFTAMVAGDVHLKRETFEISKDAPAGGPATDPQNPQKKP
jgi:hypothetical protein